MERDRDVPRSCGVESPHSQGNCLEDVTAGVRAGAEGECPLGVASDGRIAALLAISQVGNGRPGGEPCRRGQQRRAGAVAVGRVGVGRVRREAGEGFARPADRAVAGGARARVLVVPVARVVGDGQIRCRGADVRDGQRDVRVNQRRVMERRLAPSVRGSDDQVVRLVVLNRVGGPVNRPLRDCGGDPAVAAESSRLNVGAEFVRTRDAIFERGALDFVTR